MRVAIVGSSGAVGSELEKLIHARKFPHRELRLFNSQTEPSFAGVDLAFFCVSSELAKILIPKARSEGTICIDSSSTFRSDPLIPLIIPEINKSALGSHKGIIASPNCTTTLMLLPLAPIHKQWGIKRIIASTYQAVSGAGGKAIKELEVQTQAALAGTTCAPEVFPFPCAFNVFPHESLVGEDGFVEEETKMVTETKKILADPTIGVCATCVRVPVVRSHSIALNVELTKPFTKEELFQALSSAEGVEFSKEARHTALDAAGQSNILCGKLREDPTNPQAFSLWVVGDQLLKGAALNMLQIAEVLFA